MMPIALEAVHEQENNGRTKGVKHHSAASGSSTAL